jgi:signal transduction histidine kinase
VHRLTTRIGGRITVRGEPGATFTVELPSSSESDPTPMPDALLTSLGGPRP